jgi:hypothetical protein
MTKLRRMGSFLVSKTVAAGILGFLLSLFAKEVLYAVPAGMELDFAKVLFIPILILMFYVLGFFGEVRRRWWEWRRFRAPIVIGVLSGYVDNLKKGAECKSMFSSKESWQNYFQEVKPDGKRLFEVKEVYSSDLSAKYAVVINPFGEIYIEKDRRNFLTYEKIKEFVADGGIFCCTGGFPFYYYWDPVTGLPVDTTPKTRITKATGFQDIRLFFDSLVTKDFGAIITNDPPTPTQRKVYQDRPDIQFFGELCSVGGKDEVFEFRSLSEGTRGLIAGLRAKHNDEVKFPLGAISYGNGYLIVAGMDTKTDVEFQKLARGIMNFVNEIARRRKLKG